MKIFDKTEPMSGFIMGRNWQTVAKAMVDSGELKLFEDEAVTGVRIDKEYGLYFQIEKVVVRKKN